MPKNCAINLDVMETISKDRLTDRIMVLSEAKMAEVENTVHYVFELSW